MKQREDIATAFLALRDNCLSPTHANFDSPGKPYIQSIIAGSNNSSESAAEHYDVSLSARNVPKSGLILECLILPL